MTHKYLLILVAFFVGSCNSNTKVEENNEVDPKEESANEWIYLFDGKTTDGWRGYNGDKMPPGWVVKNGELSFDTELGLEQDYTGGKDIIYAKEEFDNFELYLEWKLPKGGNSGIFYHAKEGYDSPFVVAPEYQLIDDANYANIHDLTAYNTSLGYPNPEKLQPLQQTGADYAMHPTKANKKLNPIGEWNSSKIVFTETKVEHWLNGELLLSFVPWSDEWYAKKNSDKWQGSPDYGKFKTGYIGLQDHSSPIWFRNIKLKKL
ncbi:MAG: DUF1080 domain-containing protein [Bacteroidota bacterium]